MPGPHLDLKLMQCWQDVGGCDCWMGSYWDPKRSTQWWTGWHLSGPSGIDGLLEWSWPNTGWVLIGYELWGYYKSGDRLIEASYCSPNPSTTPPNQFGRQQSGHWHVLYRPNGTVKRSTWHSYVLEDMRHYLKGSSAPKGASKGSKGKGGKERNCKGKGGGKGSKSKTGKGKES